MWIKNEADSTELKLPFMDESVSFNDNGTAQVSEDVGEQLVETLDAIQRYDNDKSTEDNE